MDEKDNESKPLSQDFAQSSVEEDSPPLRRCSTADSHISINAGLADASGKLKKKNQTNKNMLKTDKSSTNKNKTAYIRNRSTGHTLVCS